MKKQAKRAVAEDDGKGGNGEKEDHHEQVEDNHDGNEHDENEQDEQEPEEDWLAQLRLDLDEAQDSTATALDLLAKRDEWAS